MTAASNSTARKRDAEAAAMAEEAAAAIHQRPASAEVGGSAAEDVEGAQIASHVVARSEAMEAVRAYLEPWAPFSGGRSIATRGDRHLFLRHLRDLVAEVEWLADVVELNQAVYEVAAEGRRSAVAELDRLTATLARVEGVEQRMADCALKAWSSASARHGCSDEVALVQHADALTRWSQRLREAMDSTAALAGEVTA